METPEKKDIFDRIMAWRIFRPLEPFYKKHKEVLLYLFFGVMTTAVSFITAWAGKAVLEGMGVGKGAVADISTVFSWVCSVTFAYVTNRVWVFESRAKGAGEILREGASFYGGRLFTLLVEVVIMKIGYAKLGFNYMLTKAGANVVVIVLNYVISKVFVFKKKS